MKQNKIKILICDDHPLIRTGIKNMLERIKGFNVIGEAENGQESIEMVKQLSPDVVIMDVSMPKMSGIEACRIISKTFPATKVLMLTMHENEEYVLKGFESGAKGYIPKNSKMTEFINAIQVIAKGENYFTPQVSRILLRGYQEKTQEVFQAKSVSNGKTFTKREKEIIFHISKGQSNKEIAEDLFISVRTVETHRKNIMSKFHLRNTADIIMYAIKNNIISGDNTK